MNFLDPSTTAFSRSNSTSIHPSFEFETINTVVNRSPGCLFGGLLGCQEDSTPWVELDKFTNSGSTSPDNKCKECPRPLGVLDGTAHNAMELRGTVKAHNPKFEYDFKRKLVGAVFHRLPDRWWVHREESQGDDVHNDDESLTPINNHIYAIDTPGSTEPQNPGNEEDIEWVQKLSMEEWVEARTDPTESWKWLSKRFLWYSIV